MKKNFLFVCMLMAMSVLTSCNSNKKNVEASATDSVMVMTDTVKAEEFAPQTVNDELAEQVKEYIRTKFLTANDMNAIQPEERRFQLYQIDLNNDGKNEVLVHFNSPYFCGTGGCTLLLLSDDLKPITKFTVTNTPIFAEHSEKNGWRVMLVRSGGELKELVYNKGKYPGNPSVLPKASYDAPSGNAEVMFSEVENAKTYEF